MILFFYTVHNLGFVWGLALSAVGCQPWSCRNRVLTSKDPATKNESLATTVFWITFLALDKILINTRCEMSIRSLLRNVVYSEAQAQLLGWKNISNIRTFLYQSKSQRKLNALLTSDATDAPPDPIWRLFPCKRIWKTVHPHVRMW